MIALSEKKIWFYTFSFAGESLGPAFHNSLSGNFYLFPNSSFAMPLLNWGAQNWVQHSSSLLTHALWGGIVTSLLLLATLLPVLLLLSYRQEDCWGCVVSAARLVMKLLNIFSPTVPHWSIPLGAGHQLDVKLMFTISPAVPVIVNLPTRAFDYIHRPAHACTAGHFIP